MSWFKKVSLRALLRVLGKLACWCVVVLCAAEALGSETPPRIRVDRWPTSDKFLDEVVLRATAELRAVWFDVEVVDPQSRPDAAIAPTFDSVLRGALIFERAGNSLTVSAWGPNSENAFIERFDTSAPHVTAEVVAVRAVEALRAVLFELPEAPKPTPPAELPSEPSGEPDPDPESSVETREPTPPEVDETTLDPVPTPKPSADSETARTRFLVALAPSLDLNPAAVEDWAASLNLGIGRGMFLLGAHLDMLLIPARVTEIEGQLQIGRQRYALFTRIQGSFSPSWFGWGQLSAGAVHYVTEAEASEGFIAESHAYFSLFGAGQLGFGYWIKHYFGVHVVGEAWAAANRMRVRIDERPIVTLGTPTGSAGAGITLLFE